MEEKKEVRSLIRTNDTVLTNWAEWMRQWEEATCASHRRGLLYDGFSVPTDGNESKDRINMYFRIADGWVLDHHWFATQKDEEQYPIHLPFSVEEPSQKNYPWEIRQYHARKAFEVLCQRIFKDQKRFDFPSWVHVMTDFDVLNATLDFFTACIPGTGTLRNLPPSWAETRGDHHVEIAKKFLEDLVERWWDPTSQDSKNDGLLSRPTHRLPQLRLKFIDALHAIGKTDLLYSRFRTLDDECLKRLEMLALLTIQQPRTIEAQVMRGSSTARSFLVLRCMRQEQSRQDAEDMIMVERIAAMQNAPKQP
jgi:hypothetical protein